MSENNQAPVVVVEDLSSKFTKPAPQAAKPVEETKQEEPKQEDKKATKEELLSSKFANLSRKEREILRKEQEVKQQYLEIQKLNELKGSAKDKINDALSFLGLTVDDVIEYELRKVENENLENDDSIEGKYKKLEKKLMTIEEKEAEKLRKEQEEAQKREQMYIDETISTFKNQINGFLQENAETYELIAAQQAHDQVFEVIEENFKQTGKMMSIQEAANLVESYFEEEARRILAQSKKLKAALPVDDAMSKAQEVIKDNMKEQEPVVQKPKVAPTLTQDVVISQAPTTGQYLSREESLKRAAQKLKWNK